MLSWTVAEAKGPLLEARQSWNRSDFRCSYEEPLVVPQQRTGVGWADSLAAREALRLPLPARLSRELDTARFSVQLFALLITNHPRPPTGGGSFSFLLPLFPVAPDLCLSRRKGSVYSTDAVRSVASGARLILGSVLTMGL